MLIAGPCAGAEVRNFTHQGFDRQYYLYLPERMAEGAPLVFMLHGHGGKALDYFPEFIQYATDNGFAVCCPQGLKEPGSVKTGWNVGYPFQKGWKVDDVEFICALSDALKAQYGFRNVFFSGMSNGGEMCYLMAYRKPTYFKAIASLAGLQMEWIYKTMKLSEPVPFIEIHGTEDHTSEWNGDPENKGGWGEYIAVPYAVGNLASLAKCTHEVCDTLPLFKEGCHTVVRHDYVGGLAETTLYEVIGGKHSRGNGDFDVPKVLIDFFTRHIDVDAPAFAPATILTPEAPHTPRINGARIYGQRPGADFLFKIPATGDRPMTFEADGLPKGLTLDKVTGIITGKARREGTYLVKLKATNSLGTDSRDLKIVIGDRLALTPPMGWSSWNCWGNTVSQEKVEACAQAMLDNGLDQYGWTYINVDDGWQYDRGGKYNAIQPNAKFPDIKGMIDRLHSNGLKFGIYSGPWNGTYAGHIGTRADKADGTGYFWVDEGICNENHMLDRSRMKRDTVRYYGPYSFAKQDALQWAEWGVDYMKYDWCPNDHYSIKEMGEALRATGRDIVYSISNSAPLSVAPTLMEYAQCWRTTGDIRDNWNSVKGICFDRQDVWAGYRRQGAWPDADMMVLGCVGWGSAEHVIKPTGLTPDEQYTHMTMWAMLSSPMLLGNDLTRLDDFTLGLLRNSEVIDINQDELAMSPAKVYGDGSYATYIKPLYDGSLAVAMFNLSDAPMKIGFIPYSLGLLEDQQIRDVWRQQYIGTVKYNDRWETLVAPHGTVLLKLSPGFVNGEPRGRYSKK